MMTSGSQAFSVSTTSSSGVVTARRGTSLRPVPSSANSRFVICSGVGAPMPHGAGAGGQVLEGECAHDARDGDLPGRLVVGHDAALTGRAAAGEDPVFPE